MLLLNIPPVDSVKLWDTIVSNKTHAKKNILLPVRKQVLERYLYYQSHFTYLDNILPLDKAVWQDSKDELISCYGDNVAFQQARKIILSDNIKCPYCLLNRPNTIDHYFDKSDYPEYAVFIPNLIPCCSECNSAKGTTVFDDLGHRKYIHFYLDYIPEYQFLFVRFETEHQDTIPIIRISLKFQD